MPMDPFEERHKVVQQLLDILKRHASDEVDSGLHKPEGEGDMHGLQIEKVEVLPDHEMDKATPEHEVDTKLIDEGKHTANMGYDKGGIVPMAEEGQPEKEGSAHEEATESEAEREEEGDIEPMFTSLFGRKKKK